MEDNTEGQLTDAKVAETQSEIPPESTGESDPPTKLQSAPPITISEKPQTSEPEPAALKSNIVPQFQTSKSNPIVKKGVLRNPVAHRPLKAPTARPLPFHMRQLKSPTYDSSKNLNLSMDAGHNPQKYVHKLHKTVSVDTGKDAIQKINASRRYDLSIQAAAADGSMDSISSDFDNSTSDQLDDLSQKQKPSASVLPFNMRNLKSPTYDSSTQLSHAFDPDHDVDNYHHGPDNTNVALKRKKATSPPMQAMRKQITQRNKIKMSEDSSPEPTSTSPELETEPTSPDDSQPYDDEKDDPFDISDEEEEKKEEASIPKKPKASSNVLPIHANVPRAKSAPVRKKPFDMNSLKSPTYDSSTQLSQAFDPRHSFQKYKHGQDRSVKVETKKPLSLQQMMMKRRNLN